MNSNKENKAKAASASTDLENERKEDESRYGRFVRLSCTSIIDHFDYFTSIEPQLKHLNISADALVGLSDEQIREIFPNDARTSSNLIRWRNSEITCKIPTMLWEAIDRGSLIRIEAVFSNISDEDTKKRLIDKKFAKTEKGDSANNRTLLHHAAASGHLGIVKSLVKYGANLNAKSGDVDDKALPIHLAAIKGHADIVRFLVEQDRDLLKAQTSNKNTPLHLAAEHGHINVVEYFVAQKVNLEMKGHIGQTALMSAAGHGHLPVVELLIRNGARLTACDDGICSRTAIHHAAYHDHAEIVEALLKADRTLLNSRGGKGKLIAYETPLIDAAMHGAINAVDVLLRNGADIDSVTTLQGQTALMVAAFGGHAEVVRKLAPLFKDVMARDRSEHGDTVMHLAAYANSSESIKILAEREPKLVNARNESGDTPLKMAKMAKSRAAEQTLRALSAK